MSTKESERGGRRPPAARLLRYLRPVEFVAFGLCDCWPDSASRDDGALNERGDR